MAGQLELEYTPPKEREVCAYYSLCDHSGTGTSAGLLFTISTLMLIYYQEYQSLEGILMEALLAGMAYTDACDQNDSYKYTKGVSMEPGFGD